MIIERKRNKVVALLVAIVMAVAMLAVIFPGRSYAASNTAVNDASKGVLQVNLQYRNDDNKIVIFAYGSGFLINSDTIVTCDHCVNLTDEELAVFAKAQNKSVAEFKDRLSYSVTVTRDVTVSATIQKNSFEMDWAIMKLGESLQNKAPLAIRDMEGSPVQQTESVYAIGFPEISTAEQDVRKYTSEDVTITSGTVNKVTQQANIWSGELTNYLQTSVKLSSGNSGGPMVDENGYVVGVCEGSKGLESSDEYFYAVTIDQVTEVCDALGIKYTVGGAVAPTEEASAEGGETEPETEAPTEPVPQADKAALQAAISAAQSVNVGDFSEETASAFTSALNKASSVMNKADATQDEVDAAVNELKSAQDGLKKAGFLGLSTTALIIIIAAIVVVAIVVVLLIVLLGKKKKNAAGPAQPPVGNGPQTMAVPPYAQNRAPQAPQGQAPQGMPQGQVPPMPPRPQAPQGQAPQGFAPVNPASPVTTVGVAGETTVLNQGAGETTVLSRNINAGTLTNVKSGEKVQINAEEFIIGRERARVNYCISGNTTVGRTHAKIVYKNGQAFIVDLKATNGTFVNGVKCAPMTEVPIKSGDKIILSDEEFTYQA